MNTAAVQKATITVTDKFSFPMKIEGLKHDETIIFSGMTGSGMIAAIAMLTCDLKELEELTATFGDPMAGGVNDLILEATIYYGIETELQAFPVTIGCKIPGRWFFRAAAKNLKEREISIAFNEGNPLLNGESLRLVSSRI
jgi:hypothetical protein